MEITFNKNLILSYHSHSQMARVLTENWVSENMYCPHCGSPFLIHARNNMPVEDFYCPDCKYEYELKSSSKTFGKKINDGAYDTMISRITSNENPDFLLLHYSQTELTVQDLILIPRYFLYPDIIEKRPPLAPTARRAGWVGCNILINKIPVQGRIPIITNGTIERKEKVLDSTKESSRLNLQRINGRGWLMDMLNCINAIPQKNFSLGDVYLFEKILQEKYPGNHNIRAKIRQQLQFLRDKGVITFLSSGQYRKNV